MTSNSALHPSIPASGLETPALRLRVLPIPLMKMSFFERYGLLTIVLFVISVGSLLYYERDRDVRMTQGLIAAIEKGNADEVQKLLTAGADPNTVTTKLVNKPTVGNLLRCTLPDDRAQSGRP